LKFGTLILTEILHTHFFNVTETLNGDTATVGKTPPDRAVQNPKICRRKKVILCTA